MGEIAQETKKARITFEVYEGNVEDLPTGYQEVSCHKIFDVSKGENLRCKSQISAGEHNTTTAYSLTY